MQTDDFNFTLPEHLIAQFPSAERGDSRLLHLRGAQIWDSRFGDLLGTLRKNDVLVLNDTRVLKARLFGVKASGGRVEVLIERLLDAHQVLAQVRASHAPKPGSELILAGYLTVKVGERAGEFFRLRFESTANVAELLEQYGQLPLPPYITHTAGMVDEARYQTIFARQPGAVAAPTAGLHFNYALLTAIHDMGVQIAYVTLHVGAGTFQPVRVQNLHEHVMHSEQYMIPQATVDAIHRTQENGGRVIAVGTTSLRALESAAQQSAAQYGKLVAGAGETRIFITPGYIFKVVDVLLTNFHLPKTTLLMLVCAFGGTEHLLAAYRYAVAKKYRFFSYGDAMLIERRYVD
ncbi:MAG: tRNA preQ1(34) S-adenosylmethionine ribosyltransferase-isomerase QueA [Candidatus Nitrotoga sp.]